MYLKFIRYYPLTQNSCRGTLYIVHYQPNEKGGYTERLTRVCSAHENVIHQSCTPLPLIFPVGIVRNNDHVRLTYGRGRRRAALYLAPCFALEQFLIQLQDDLNNHIDCLIDISLSRNYVRREGRNNY